MYLDIIVFGMILFHDCPRCSFSRLMQVLVWCKCAYVAVFQFHTFLNMVPRPSTLSNCHQLPRTLS